MIPQQFKDGYMTVKEIKEKRDSIDKIFSQAEKVYEEQIDKLKKI